MLLIISSINGTSVKEVLTKTHALLDVGGGYNNGARDFTISPNGYLLGAVSVFYIDCNLIFRKIIRRSSTAIGWNDNSIQLYRISTDTLE